MFDSGPMAAELNALPGRAAAALDEYGRSVAARLEAEAKEKGPSSGPAARTGLPLKGSVERTESGIRVILESAAQDAASREFAHEKKNAVLCPTLKRAAPQAMQGLRNLLERLE